MHLILQKLERHLELISDRFRGPYIRRGVDQRQKHLGRVLNALLRQKTACSSELVEEGSSPGVDKRRTRCEKADDYLLSVYDDTLQEAHVRQVKVGV